MPERRYYDVLKRSMDLMGSLAGLGASAPVLALAAILIRVTMGPPILFRQVRPGLGGKTFVLYKLRTMMEVDEQAGPSSRDGDRLTRIGRFLRRTSIDELPELWNVIRGDMSLVGPRPLLVDYLSLYTPQQARRHEVRPGLTGLAQVSGRNALNWDERFRLDVWYVDNRSTSLDLRILLRTVAKVLRMEGISGRGHATMQPYDGSAPPISEVIP